MGKHGQRRDPQYTVATPDDTDPLIPLNWEVVEVEPENIPWFDRKRAEWGLRIGSWIAGEDLERPPYSDE